MYYKVWSKAKPEHLWTYQDFKSRIEGIVVDYRNNGNVIEYIIYKVSKPIPQQIFDEFHFNYEIINELPLKI